MVTQMKQVYYIITMQNPCRSGTNIHMTITDPALNIDPTTADTWEFGLDVVQQHSAITYFANNGTVQ